MTTESTPKTEPHDNAEPASARKISRRSILALGGAFVAGLGLGAGGGEISRHSAAKNLARKTNETAQAKAQYFTAALYDGAHYAKGVPMPVLNGEIVTTIVSPDGTKHTGTYKNPILLATRDNSGSLDKKGDFLDGAYLGIQGNDQNGRVVITAVPYDKVSQKFRAYDAAHIQFDNLGVYAVEGVKGGPDYDADGLVAFDLMDASHPVNGDGSIIQPGLSLGMK